MEIKGRYYFIKNKNFAVALSYILMEDFYTFDDRYNPQDKIYSFKNTEKLHIALEELNQLRSKLND